MNCNVLLDNVCIVTGGGGGMGKAIGKRLARNESSVVLADSDVTAATETAYCASAGGET